MTLSGTKMMVEWVRERRSLKTLGDPCQRKPIWTPTLHVMHGSSFHVDYRSKTIHPKCERKNNLEANVGNTFMPPRSSKGKIPCPGQQKQCHRGHRKFTGSHDSQNFLFIQDTTERVKREAPKREGHWQYKHLAKESHPGAAYLRAQHRTILRSRWMAFNR